MTPEGIRVLGNVLQVVAVVLALLTTFALPLPARIAITLVCGLVWLGFRLVKAIRKHPPRA